MAKLNSEVIGGDILAAGGLLWRRAGRTRELAVVRRKRYDDWSLPKGHVDQGESLLTTALREVREETGCSATAVEFAATTTYPVEGHAKYVLFWTMAFVAEVDDVDANEIASVHWLTYQAALERLSFPGERDVLRAARHQARRAVP